MHANHREDIEEADAGAIVASLGLKNTLTGDTLCHYAHPVILESIRFPEPVLSIAIEPKTKGDQDRMEDALRKLTEEDPTFKVTYNKETGQTLISGMGELHLDVLINRALSEFGVAAKVGTPRVAYKETITIPVKAEGRFVQQTGGHGQYGHVRVEFEPLPRGSGFEFINQVKSGAIPRQFVSPVERGIKEAMETGGVAGYPVIDVKATLYDGSYHEVDSSELAFKIAGSMALKEALAKGKPALLEPIMKLVVVTPQEFVGDIIADLNSRRGHIEAIESHGDTTAVHCYVPLSETFGYTTIIRSLTQGRATHTMEFYRYQEMPVEMTEEIRITGKRNA
jgi:elongation factor G